MYSVWLLHHCSASVSDSWSDMESMFVQVHNSIHCTFCSRHEQRLLHGPLTQPHFTSCKTDCGARGTLVRTGMSSPFASRDHRAVGNKYMLPHMTLQMCPPYEFIHCSLGGWQFLNSLI